jgi:hypothetical protein
MHTGFWWGKPEGRRPLGRHGMDVRIILKWTLEKWGGGGGARMDLVQDRDRWRALVNTLMNFWVP